MQWLIKILCVSCEYDTVKISGESVEMSWSCGHHGYINSDWLKKNKYPDASKQTVTTISSEPTTAVWIVTMESNIDILYDMASLFQEYIRYIYIIYIYMFPWFRGQEGQIVAMYSYILPCIPWHYKYLGDNNWL